MHRYFRLIRHFAALSWMRAMEYRTDFLTWVLVDVGWSAMDLIFFSSLINFTQVIGDWNKGQSLIVLGVFRLMVIPVWGWMFSSFKLLPRLISEGGLDMLLIKPIDSQFMVSTKDFSFSILPSLISGTVFLGMGFSYLHTFPTFFQIIMFLWLSIISVVLTYAFYFLTMTPVLFADRLDNIYHIFPTLFDSAKYPAQIYPIFWQRIFTTIVPMAIMLVVPAESLFAPLHLSSLLAFHLITIVFVILGRQIWLTGLRRYSSASS
jgi:ABC-2 type transport system permease protein